MVTLYSFEEIDNLWGDFENWSVKHKELSRLRNANRHFKKMWDAIKAPEGFAGSRSVIRELAMRFPSDPSASVHRPLGDFKDLMGLSHEEIFNSLVEQITRPRKNREGKMVSYLDEMLPHCQHLWDTYFPSTDKKWMKWNEDATADGWALMLYRSAVGIYLEGAVHKALEGWVTHRPKLAELVTYEPADADKWESKDVDGLFRDKETGKVLVKVSIKCLGALEEDFIKNTYRGKKGKTQPDIYIGYRQIRDTKLTTVKIEGDLKTLLRGRM